MEDESRERWIGDLRSVIADAEELLRATTSQAGDAVATARQKIEQSLIEGKKALADAEELMIQRSREAADIADDYVRENPWSAIGIAAGLGLLAGLMLRRGSNSD